MVFTVRLKNVAKFKTEESKKNKKRDNRLAAVTYVTTRVGRKSKKPVTLPDLTSKSERI